MECKQTELGDLFSFYLNGDLHAEQEEMIEEHLAQCTACQQELLFWIALAQQGLPPRKPDAGAKKPKAVKQGSNLQLTRN